MIPVNEPLLGAREKELLCECIDTGWISSDGPFVKKFEQVFSNFIGAKHGVAVCNGTAALEAALHAIGVSEGDEVILPSFTIISCAIAIIRLGAKPVLVDIEPRTWNMDVTQIENKITPKTKAIMAVHMYGHPVDMDPVLDLAKKYNLMVIEDAAEVHGAEYKGRKLGSIGNVSAFSFYANKIISTGEGGMVLTSNPEIAKRAESYRNLYFKSEQRFLHDELGYNFRLTNLQAAVGLAQMERIESLIKIKRRLGEYYKKCLSEITEVKFQEEMPWAKSVYWMYSIELDQVLGLTAKDLMQKLHEKGIGSRPFFLGLHSQPVFKNKGLFIGEEYPITDRAAKYGLYLPSGLTLTEEKVDIVCRTLKNILENN